MKSWQKLTLILLGNFMIAFGVSFFLVPAGLISGGATGMALVLYKAFGLPMTVGIWGVSILFFALGFFALGKRYALSILLSSVAYPLFYSLTDLMARRVPTLTDDIFLCTAFAGICLGIGIGLVMRAGASTGGSDVIAMALYQKRGVPLQTTIYLVDAVILCLQIPFSKPEQVLYGLLYVLIYSFLLGKVMLFGQGKLQLLIYSRMYEEINSLILKDFDKGSTLIHAEGGFGREAQPVIQTILPQRSLFTLREAILKQDPTAFIVINPVSEVNGRGFTLDRRSSRNP